MNFFRPAFLGKAVLVAATCAVDTNIGANEGSFSAIQPVGTAAITSENSSYCAENNAYAALWQKYAVTNYIGSPVSSSSHILPARQNKPAQLMQPPQNIAAAPIASAQTLIQQVNQSEDILTYYTQCGLLCFLIGSLAVLLLLGIYLYDIPALKKVLTEEISEEEKAKTPIQHS